MTIRVEEANGHSAPRRPPLPEVQEEYKRARLEYRLAEARAHKALLESWLPPSYTGTGPGQPVDMMDRFRDGNRWIINLMASPADRRQSGQPVPSVQSEEELFQVQARSRWLLDTNGIAQGLLSNFRNFTIRQGFQYRVVAEDGAEEADANAPALAALADELLAGMRDRAEWSEREKRWFWRSRRDGETFIRSRVNRSTGETTVRTIDPEEIRNPPDANEDGYSWGVQTEADDPEARLAYAHVWGPRADQWERIPADEIDHIKLNTDENVLRGLSDFFSGWEALDETDRLLKCLRRGATIQACITGVRSFENASKATAENFVQDIRSKVFSQPPGSTLSTTENVEGFKPGTIIQAPKGVSYSEMPWISSGAANHIAIAQACLRAVGARWCMPEYMVSGDVSNTPFASNLVAGSPFVVNCETEQSFYRLHFLRVHWKALKALADAGRLKVGSREYSYEECCALLDIECDVPTVAIQDQLQQTTIKETEHRNGIISKQKWRSEAGYDSDRMRSELEEEPATQPQPIPPVQSPGGPPGFFPRVAGG
jgi:hypothetical protein